MPGNPAALRLVFLVQFFSAYYGYPDCFVPHSYTEGCRLTAQDLGCGSAETRCCVVCPGTACKGASGVNVHVTTPVCAAASAGGVLNTCGTPKPIYFDSDGAKVKFVQAPSDKNLNTALLVRNFRLVGRKPPEVYCYAPASKATLGPGPIDTGNNPEMGAPRPPVEKIGDKFKTFRFQFSTNNLRSFVNSYMCDFESDNKTAEVISPVGFAYFGKTLPEVSMEPDSLTKHLNSSGRLFISLPNASRKAERAWNFETTEVGQGSTLTKAAANCSDAGTYRVFSKTLKDQYSLSSQGLIRVIVTEGQTNHSSCAGGMLLNGNCLCPPGLKGFQCEKACDGTKFGLNCEYALPPHEQLAGAMLCLPDPYGCDCVPGYTGLTCSSKCPKWRFGIDCRKKCHCEEGTCSPYNGRCKDNACAPGYQGDNCQQECDSKRYGPKCNNTCHCSSAYDCSHVVGPSVNCTCEDRWLGEYCNISAIDPQVTVKVTQENPGIAPSLRCIFKGIPIPMESEVNVTTVVNKTLKILKFTQIGLGENELVVEANTLPYKAGESVEFSCCVSTYAGEACRSETKRPYELLKMNIAPRIEQATQNSFKLRFKGWTPESGSGDPPAVDYQVCYRPKGVSVWQYQNSSINLKDCAECPFIVKGLEPDSLYELAVAVKRPGGPEAWGPCGAVTVDFTLQGQKSVEQPQNNTVLKKIEEMQNKLNAIETKLSNCCCSRTVNSDCHDVYMDCCASNGEYNIMPDWKSDQLERVWCQNGWTRVLLRSTGSLNFDRSWEEYKSGFGSRSDDHWLGLATLHRITKNRRYRLRVEMIADSKHVNNGLKVTEFAEFSVGNESSGYKLHLRNITRNDLADVHPESSQKLLSQHGHRFSTWDQDSDTIKFINCALKFGGGWWLGDQCIGSAPTSSLKWLGGGRCSSENTVCAMYGLYYAQEIELLIAPV